MSSFWFLLRHAANQVVACLGGASCLTNNRPRGGPGAVLFLRCNKKRTADVFVFRLLRHAANQAVALSEGGVLSYQQTGLEVGRVLFLFLRVTTKQQQMSSFWFLLRHAANQAVACLGGASCLTNNRPRGGPGAVLFLRCNKKRTADVFVLVFTQTRR